MAANNKDKTEPSATVPPIACNTGEEENARAPKALTVLATHTNVENRARRRSFSPK